MPPTDVPPRIWLLLGHKQGDNGQVETLADVLAAQFGWHSERKQLQVHKPFVFGKPKVGPTLYHIDTANSAPLEPPWPDLILTIGRSPANAALWVKQQSGGHTRLVLIGKPSGFTERFDLIVTSAETLLAPYPNVLCVDLPLMRINAAKLDIAADAWRDRLTALPRPLVGVFIGGPTNPYVYNKRLISALTGVADSILAEGGTPWLVSSRRTPTPFLERLRQSLPSGTRLYDWNDKSAENPYLGLLALADRFVVTGDSISMMVEVIHRHKPLQILPLPTGLAGGIDQLRRRLARRLFQPPDPGAGGRARLRLTRLVYRLHLIRHTRHFPGFHQRLVDLGLATWWGDTPAPPSNRIPDAMATILARVVALSRDARTAARTPHV